MNDFSAKSRKEHIRQLKDTEFDLLVIGGGITGAGIALDAVTRGLKVALVEKKDFAWGTSSRSTKLIHGGLRYLKQLEIGLVREVGMERAVVYRNAMHIVRPEKMLLPIIIGGSLGKTMSSFGLWVYDFLADVDSEEKRKMLTVKKTAKTEPLLRTDVLKGGGLYYEYRSDDARLTIENIKTAVRNGALCLNYIEVEDFELDANNRIEQIRVKDHIGHENLIIRAKEVVNATGPWVDTLRVKKGGRLSNRKLHLTKGVHIVVPYQKLPLKQSVYFDVESDNRMVFAIPRGNITYIGTTDTTYNQDIGTPTADFSDVEYILNAANFIFPSVNLKVEDVISSWAGLRPLIHEEGKDPSELSRKDEIFYGENGLISIAGGKLTGYRKMSERVVDVVVERLGGRVKGVGECKTETLGLGGYFKSEKEMEKFIIARTGESKQIGLKQKDVHALVLKYGKETDLIIEKAFELYPTIKDVEKRIHIAELWYSIHHEMSHNLSDYLIRRTGRLYFERTEIEAVKTYLNDCLTKEFSWDETESNQSLDDFNQEYFSVVAFKEGSKTPSV